MADDNTPDVTEESRTSGEANPMEQAPAEPTAAQVEQGAEPADDVSPNGQAEPSESARSVANDDAQWRLDNPFKVRTREANAEAGGESFEYLKSVRD